MSKHHPIIYFLKNGGFFILLLAVTFYLLLKDQNLPQLFIVLRYVDPRAVITAILCMCLSITCDAVNLGRLLAQFGYPFNLLKNIKYSLAGFFFSSITPSSSGGQPMEIYYMHLDQISFSHSALALLINFSSFQTAAVLFAIIGFSLQYEQLTFTVGKLKYLLLAGIIMNILIITFVLICIFSKKAAHLFINLVLKLFAFFKYHKLQQLEAALNEQLEEYQSSAQYLHAHKFTILLTFLISLLQVITLHGIPYWIYRSFKLHGYGFFSILTLQAVLYIAVSALPFPGAVGISESGFLTLFKTFFPPKYLEGAMLLSRGISFYLFVAVSGIMTSCYSLIYKTKKAK